MESMAN